MIKVFFSCNAFVTVNVLFHSAKTMSSLEGSSSWGSEIWILSTVIPRTYGALQSNSPLPLRYVDFLVNFLQF